MQDIYSTYLDQLDKERIERIEFLGKIIRKSLADLNFLIHFFFVFSDEANLLEQLLNHYSITVGYKGFNAREDEVLFGFV